MSRIQPLGINEMRRANDPRPWDEFGLLIKWQGCKIPAIGSASIGEPTWLMWDRRDAKGLHIEHQSFRLDIIIDTLCRH